MNEKTKATEERKRAEALRIAFESDKQTLENRIEQLESALKEKETEKQDAKRKFGLLEQNDQV